MWTVRAGSQRAEADQRRGRDVAGVVVLDDDRARSRRARSASAAARPAVIADAGRVVRPRLEEHRARPRRRRAPAQPVDRHAVVVDVDADHVARRAARAGRAAAGTWGARRRPGRRGGPRPGRRGRARPSRRRRRSAPRRRTATFAAARPPARAAPGGRGSSTSATERRPRAITGPRSGSRAGSGVPVDRSSAKCPGPSVTRR